MAKNVPGLDFERSSALSGARAIAGVDEAGRGPLAGPVVAAAVIFDLAKEPPPVNDSKKLSRRAREALYEMILRQSTASAIGVASVDEIERLNIRAASLLAMRRAVLALALPPDMALIDGNATPEKLPCPARAIIAGDAHSASIAAASILAKVTRDAMMARLHARFPHYGFDANAGYGTASHLRALQAYGPCECHRAGFAPVRAALRTAR